MIHFDEACRNIDRAHARVLKEMHPDLEAKVQGFLRVMGKRTKLWCGFRNKDAQEQAFDNKVSNAHWGQSPHNFKPCLAVDIVLDPRYVPCRAAPSDPEWPDLWDVVTIKAMQTWRDVESAAAQVGLQRVNLSAGRLDLPHLQLPNWRTYIPN